MNKETVQLTRNNTIRESLDWDYRILGNIRSAGSVISGVYCITNETNGKVYIGSSKDIYARVVGHRNKLEQNKHANKYLQRAFNESGAAFSVEIVTICPEADRLVQEQKYIGLFNATDPVSGYNIAKDALAPMAGRQMTEEQKRKISQSLKEAGQRDEVRSRKSEILRERWKNDPTYREKMTMIAVKTHGGKQISPQQRERFRKTLAEKYPNGRPTWNKGKTGVYSKETLEAMSKKRTGVSPTNKGKKFNKVTRHYE